MTTRFTQQFSHSISRKALFLCKITPFIQENYGLQNWNSIAWGIYLIVLVQYYFLLKYIVV